MSQRTLEAGSAVGPYLIDTVLGLGQCGITYQAHDGQSGIACVVKEFFPRAQATRGNDQSLVPLPDCNDDLQLGVQRFLHDAHALARISHPNIVRVLGAIEANNTAYMVMAHETGDKLAEALKRGFSPTPEALLSISLSLIDAVQALHRDGLIHRDVKENNVHLRADATPVLLDFGAARVGLLRRRLALGNAVRGDADYDNLDGNAGPWTDMHALAAMLFRLASSLGKTGGGRTCPPEIAEAIRFGIAAQQNNVASLVEQWRSRLEDLARTYHVQWPVPVAEEVPPATIVAEATLSEVAPGGSDAESSADAIVDVDVPVRGDAQDAGVPAVAPADSTSGDVADQDQAGTGEAIQHDANVVDTGQIEVAQAEVAQAEVAQAEAGSDAAELEKAEVPAEAAGQEATSTSEVAAIDAGDIPGVGDVEQRASPRSASRGAGRKTRRQRKKERLKEKASRTALERVTMSADSTPLANVEPQHAHAIDGVAPASDASEESPRPADRTEFSTPILKVAAVQHEDVALERMPVVDPNPERAPERAIDPQSPDFVVDFDVAPAAGDDGGVPAGRKSGVFLAVASFVAVVGILVGLAWMRYQEDRARTSTVKAPAVQLPASDPVAAPAPTSAVPLEPMVASPPLVDVDPPAPASAGPVAPDPQTESRIAELLARADNHLQALHLTTPVGENAFEDFNAVLQLQPENEAAKRGIAEISARYVELADGAMVRGEFVAARRYLELAEMVDPGNTSVAGRREQLQSRRQASRAARDSEVVAEASVADGGATRDDGVVDRVRDFLQPAPGAPAPASRADEIRERLGGQ